MIGIFVLAGVMVVAVVLAAMRAGVGFVVDLVERVAWTYIETLLGLLLAGTALDHFSNGTYSMGDLNVALLSAVPAAIAALKGSIASFLGMQGTASTLPASAPPSAIGGGINSPPPQVPARDPSVEPPL